MRVGGNATLEIKQGGGKKTKPLNKFLSDELPKAGQDQIHNYLLEKFFHLNIFKTFCFYYKYEKVIKEYLLL